MLSDRRFTIYRTTHLSPRQGTLLGLIWIVVQRNRELGRGALEAARVWSPIPRREVFG